VSPANPSYTVDELVYQLELVAAKVLITHPVSLDAAVGAARKAGLPMSAIIVAGQNVPQGFTRIDDLVAEGLRERPHYSERVLKPGEAKTKLAFLSLSVATCFSKTPADNLPSSAPLAPQGARRQSLFHTMLPSATRSRLQHSIASQMVRPPISVQAKRHSQVRVPIKRAMYMHADLLQFCLSSTYIAWLFFCMEWYYVG